MPVKASFRRSFHMKISQLQKRNSFDPHTYSNPASPSDTDGAPPLPGRSLQPSRDATSQSAARHREDTDLADGGVAVIIEQSNGVVAGGGAGYLLGPAHLIGGAISGPGHRHQAVSHRRVQRHPLPPTDRRDHRYSKVTAGSLSVK